MPIVALALLIVAVIVASVLLLPLTLVRRYRVGTSRQQARGWLIAINLAGFGASALMFLVGSAITALWIPNALRYSALGLAAGVALGIIGLWLTRWEPTARALHYTPNRYLVLAITLTIVGRIGYSFWRAWETWGNALDRQQWLVTWGVAEALGAAGLVLGYYLSYWFGVRRRFKRHEQRPLRSI